MTVAIIPASGKAERFGGLPKFLLPANGKGNCLLDLQIMRVQDLVDEIVITVPGHYVPLVEDRKSFWPQFVPVTVLENEPSTMPQAFRAAASIRPHSNYLCLFPDTYYQFGGGAKENPVRVLMDEVSEAPNDLTLALWTIASEQYGKLGQVEFDYVGKNVLAVRDKELDCKLPLAWGAFYFPRELIESVSDEDLHMGIPFNRVLTSGRTVKGVLVEGRYRDIAGFAEYQSLLGELDTIS